MEKIGLVLSGGFAKGAYQVGILKAVRDLIDCDNIKIISGGSVGALNAYAFANGRLDELEEVWKSLEYKSMTSFIREKLQGTFLDNTINSITAESRPMDLDLYFALLNLTKKELEYINTTPLEKELQKKYARATVAFPAFNMPVKINDDYYLDGALVDNIPIYPLVGEDIDAIICMYFEDYNFNFENDKINEKTIRINCQSEMFLKNAIIFKHEYIVKMIDDGYEYGKKIIEKFFENGILIDNYKEKIREFNKDNENVKWYITCDIVATKVNKVLSKIFKAKERNVDVEREVCEDNKQ